MAKTAGRWEQIRERRLNTPELREQYENSKREVTLTRQMLMQIDEQRRQAGLSKAALARGIEADPATIRRLFTAPTANPNMRTVFRLLDALGMDFEIRKVRPPNTTLFATEVAERILPLRRAAATSRPKRGKRPRPTKGHSTDANVST